MSRDRDEHKEVEDFASRWSRLKRGAKERTAEAPPADAQAGSPPEQPDERGDEDILRELGLPDPDSLKPGDDFRAFMASAVPARIRNRALRRLWTSNPVLANLDRLVDYDDDFTDAAMIPTILKTGYRVGRGWLDEPDEEAAEAKTEPAAGAEDGTSGAGEDARQAAERAPTREARRGADAASGNGGEALERPEPEAPDPAPEDAAAAAGGAPEAAADAGDSLHDGAARSGPAGRPRHMRFRFTEG